MFRVAIPGIAAAVCYRAVGGGLVEDSRVGLSEEVKQMSCQKTSAEDVNLWGVVHVDGLGQFSRRFQHTVYSSCAEKSD